MSMTAEFVQVNEFEVARIRSNSSALEAMFGAASGAVSQLGKLAEITPQMQERVRQMGPQMFAKVAANMSPELRKALEERVGISIEALAAGEGGDVLAKLVEAQRNKAAEAMSMAGKGKRMSLDKSWHGLHFLLCGSTEPDGTLLGQAVLGGTDLEKGEGFSGYGPARLLKPDDVKKISDELNLPAVKEQAASRFNAGKMNALEIYPGFRASDAKELVEAFEKLRAFYTDAAGQGNAIVTCLV